MTLADWQRHVEALGSEHKVILQSTLPTDSFIFLLQSSIRDCKEQLTELDLSRKADDFKQKYHSIKLQQGLAESLLEFVKSLLPERQQ